MNLQDIEKDSLLAFAQFLKRIGYEDYRRFAASDEEAYGMQNAGEKIREILADMGVSPR